MEYGYWPEHQIEKELKKSKKTIILTSVLSLVLFSSAIVGGILYFGKKESVIINDKLDVVENKIDSISETQSRMENSLYEINNRLDKTIEDNQIVISGIGNVNNKITKVNSKIDTIVIYIKK